jgi:hypothetical protein
MFRIDFMPRFNNTALEQGESGLDRVRVDVAMRILFGTIDRAMPVPLNLGQRQRMNLGFIGATKASGITSKSTSKHKFYSNNPYIYVDR